VELFVPGPVGRLEALYGAPARAPKAAAIACHPHPLHGGTMKNTAVFRLARGLQRAGVAVLRFNFRGVEHSDGEHDGTGGEELDAAAGLDWLEARHPGLELWAAGFSFGARTALGLAMRDGRVRRVALVALPVLRFDCSAIESVRQPTLLVMGARDEFGNAGDLARLHRLPPAARVEEIAGADHFFRGHTPELEDAVRRWAELEDAA
jgi:alpha/beta superfamily hydrolase